MQDNGKKFLYLKYLPLVIIGIVVFKLVNQHEIIFNWVKVFMNLTMPFIWGFVIAYLLNPTLRYLEKRWNLKRHFSMLITYSIFLLILIGLLVIIIPTFIQSVTDIVKEFPKPEVLTKMYYDALKYVENSLAWVNDINIDVSRLDFKRTWEYIDSIPSKLQGSIATLGMTLYDISFGVLKFIVGIMISIYLLIEKEKFGESTKKMLRAYLGEERASFILKIATESDEIFSKFIIGKAIDSTIIGILCMIGLSIMNVRYSLVLSLMVGITNMIPYFGPFIGAVPAVIITLLYSPILALQVSVFILVLQQLDGYIIGPAILGDSIGISAFWIIFAVIVGGGLFGVMGMLLGVPVVTLIRNLVNRDVENILRKRESSI